MLYKLCLLIYYLNVLMFPIITDNITYKKSTRWAHNRSDQNRYSQFGKVVQPCITSEHSDMHQYYLPTFQATSIKIYREVVSSRFGPLSIHA